MTFVHLLWMSCKLYTNLSICQDLHKFSAADNLSGISLDMEMVKQAR